ncbi:MAG: helix-turn-helix transcriptional regulator [Firmicutes bacterium]|nr:helix-turn-helix transcriptional regulator [Bacillota bacterium]
MRFGYTGLGLVQGWLWAFFLSGPLLIEVTQQPGQTEKVFICFLFFNSLAYLLTARAAIKYSPLLKRRRLLVISGLLASAGPLLVGLFAAAPSSLPLPAMVIFAAAASGFGGAVLVIAWGELNSHLPAKTAGLYFAGAVLLGTLLSYFCTYFAYSIVLVLLLIISLVLPHLGSTLISLLESYSYFPSFIILGCLPLLSLLMLLLRYRAEERKPLLQPPLPEPSVQSRVFPIPSRMVLLIILYYLAGGFMYKLISINWPFSGQEAYYLSNTVYCGVTILAGLCIYLIREVDLRYLYRPVLPLLGAGFLLFPLVYSMIPYLSFVLFQAGFALFDTYTWLLFVYMGSRHRYPALVVGSGFFLITLSILVGEVSTTLIFPSLMVDPSDLNRVSLFAALLMLLGTLAFQGQKETFAGWEAPFAAPEPAIAEMEAAAAVETADSENFEPTLEDGAIREPAAPDVSEPEPIPPVPERVYHYDHFTDRGMVAEKQPDPIRLGESYSFMEQVDRLTRSYGLTRRENEVLLMLLQGRNNPFIREQLNISNNTLKTHLRNLYNKLSVKNRQELLSRFVMIDGQSEDQSHVFPIH